MCKKISEKIIIVDGVRVHANVIWHTTGRTTLEFDINNQVFSACIRDEKCREIEKIKGFESCHESIFDDNEVEYSSTYMGSIE